MRLFFLVPTQFYNRNFKLKKSGPMMLAAPYFQSLPPGSKVIYFFHAQLSKILKNRLLAFQTLRCCIYRINKC